ncbi:MAG TPA: hypothetical protein VLJ38_17080 [Polyangiaceae bacterium]|nr:hypothetical protein [Polyangiaceae bacterium]
MGFTADLLGVSGAGDAPGADGGFGNPFKSVSVGRRAESALGAFGAVATRPGVAAGFGGTAPRDAAPVLLGGLAASGALLGRASGAAVRVSGDVVVDRALGTAGAFGTTGGGASQSASSGGLVSGAGGI